MKRLVYFSVALLVLAFAATPALAQGPNVGDQFCMGGSTLIPAGEVANSWVLFGCSARIQSGARINRDLVSFGGDIVLESGARIGGNLVAFGGSGNTASARVRPLNVDRSLAQTVYGSVDIAGEVGHDVTVFGGNVILEPTAVIGHDVTVVGGTLDRKEGAVVRGQVVRGGQFTVAPFTVTQWGPFLGPFGLGGGVLGFLTSAAVGFIRSLVTALALAALGALTVVFLPTQTRQVGDTAEKSALPSLGVGCLTVLVAPMLLLLLIITIIGIPVAALLVLALFVAWLFGWIALGRLVGTKVLEALKVQEILPIVAVVIGVILFAVLGLVPVLGGLLSLVIGLIGFGAVVLTRFGTQAYPLVPGTPAAAPPSLATPTASGGAGTTS